MRGIIFFTTAQLLSTSVLALKYEYELNCQEKVTFVNSSQNEGLSPSCIALSFDGFGSIFTAFCLFFWDVFFRVFTVLTFRISKFISAWAPVVEIRICASKFKKCIQKLNGLMVSMEIFYCKAEFVQHKKNSTFSGDFYYYVVSVILKIDVW
jgi:hypothetical protein